MKLQTITAVVFSALHAVSASPLSRTLVTRSEVPSAGELSSNMAVFQTLITDALRANAPANASLPKRDDYSSALDNVNSIFDTIYGVADGSVTIAEASLARRQIDIPGDIWPIVHLICRLIFIHCPLEVEMKRDAAPHDVRSIIDTLNAWADGTIPFELGTGADFTPEDATELATLLKNIVVAWRAKVDAGITSRGSVAARNAAPVAGSSIYGALEDLEKRGVTRGEVKVALKAVAALLNLIADAL